MLPEEFAQAVAWARSGAVSLHAAELRCTGYQHDKVGRALGVSDGTVKSTLHRARQILGPALGIDDPTEEVTHDARP